MGGYVAGLPTVIKYLPPRQDTIPAEVSAGRRSDAGG
jgi:hypothetical protein